MEDNPVFRCDVETRNPGWHERYRPGGRKLKVSVENIGPGIEGRRRSQSQVCAEFLAQKAIFGTCNSTSYRVARATQAVKTEVQLSPLELSP
jgi:hypothetical protein